MSLFYTLYDYLKGVFIFDLMVFMYAQYITPTKKLLICLKFYCKMSFHFVFLSFPVIFTKKPLASQGALDLKILV